jgi:predicted DNA-binding transcriptional regulator YafY
LNISRIHRLLRLITILQSGQAPSVNDLAQELDISRRTLFRDLKILEAAGIPYYHKQGTGYHIARHFFLPPVNLTIPEILSLMVMGKEAQARRNRPLKKPALDAIAKLSATVPEPIRTVCQELTASVTIDPGPMASDEGESLYYSTCMRCIDECRVCQMQYKSPVESAPLECEIEPYALHFSTRAWYLLGKAEEHQQVRVFKLARMLELEPTEKRFQRPRDFSVESKLGQAWQLIPEGKVYDIELEFTAKVGTNVAEVRWHSSQKTRMLSDGRCCMSFRVDGLSEIAWWLCGYADQVTILKPAKLRQRVMGMLQSAVERHGA